MYYFQSPPLSSSSFSRIPELTLMHEGLNNILATIQVLAILPAYELFTCSWS